MVHSKRGASDLKSVLLAESQETYLGRDREISYRHTRQEKRTLRAVYRLRSRRSRVEFTVRSPERSSQRNSSIVDNKRETKYKQRKNREHTSVKYTERLKTERGDDVIYEILPCSVKNK